MEKLIINGGRPLKGEVRVSGAKNVAMKVLLTGLLTDKPIYVRNIPLISSVHGTAEIIKPLGVNVKFHSDHSVKIQGDGGGSYKIPLDLGGKYRTATMVMGPLLARFGKAIVPNPGGCRLGKRPIDRHIAGLISMGAKVQYKDGYFYATAVKLHGTKYKFSHNTHTGTESMILAAVLTEGETVLDNAAQEPEIDDLIGLLTMMGAQIKRIKKRTIVINGVKKLHGAEFSIMSDRNEVVTFAIGAITTGGDIIVEGTDRDCLQTFFTRLDTVGACWKPIARNKTRFSRGKNLKCSDIKTGSYPGFMTDWQAPWAVLMTQAKGTSIIHETIYEDRFGYVNELIKMGANIRYFNPKIKNPRKIYNFNWKDSKDNCCQAIKIKGKTELHNAVLEVTDLRAGATIIIGAACAKGESVIHGVEHIDRGYEDIENRLAGLGLNIERTKEKV